MCLTLSNSDHRKHLGASKAAQLLGLTVKTLQRWERGGRLVPVGRSDTDPDRGILPGVERCTAPGHGRPTRRAGAIHQETLSPEPEMVQDLMTIVHCFSSRLYGLRSYRRKLNEALEQDHAAGPSHPA